jgi:hypothetical protein
MDIRWTHPGRSLGAVLLAAAAAAAPVRAPAAGADAFPLREGTVLRLADAEEAAKALGTVDAYVEAMSPFDRCAILKSKEPVTREQYLAFVRKQALAWGDGDREGIRKVVDDLRPRIAPLGLRLPAEVLLVKTTGDEEGEAAYTRGNAVFLPPAMTSPLRTQLLAHELFHVLSRQDPKQRDSLYAILGFKPCGEVALPADLLRRKITNPDALTHSHCLEVTRGKERIHVLPVLFSRRETYDPKEGGTFFNYLVFRMMAVSGKDGKWTFTPDAAGKPLLLPVSAIPDFLDRVGRNTDYLIHPEEILADNFALLVLGKKDLPTPRIPEEMRQVFERFAGGK